MQKILIVDDEKMMLKLASKILSKSYETVCASSGAEAIALFEKEKPDMVLSDLLMPEMDGYELHRRLQEKNAYPVPIMFMTADESDESESRGFEIGAADYIRKPLKADILMRRVGKIMENLDKLQGLQQAVDLDTMTGLLNKAASQREIGKLCESSQGVLMMIDLDSFKLVNDIHGHGMGDRILVKFSELLNHIIRSEDIAGRMGGDEFIAFCQNIDSENVVAEKTKFLNEQILVAAKKYMGEDMNIPLGVSIGAVFIPNEGKNFELLYKKADQALYKVKQNGKHGFSIYSENKNSTETLQENFSSIHKILGERNITNDAYYVESDYFKVIYRLCVRLVLSYKKSVQFLALNILNGDTDEFKNLLIKSLRKSDCITQYNQKQFLILLMETTTEEIKFVKNRILAKARSNNFEIEFIEECNL